MATIILTSGVTEDVEWEAGGANRALIDRVFGGRTITSWRTTDGRLAIADDCGLLDDLPTNRHATELYAGPTPICGDVIVLTHEETRADMEAL